MGPSLALLGYGLNSLNGLRPGIRSLSLSLSLSLFHWFWMFHFGFPKAGLGKVERADKAPRQMNYRSLSLTLLKRYVFYICLRRVSELLEIGFRN
jgi:hypothetical protein